MRKLGLAFLLLAGPVSAAEPFVSLPARFAGTLPCADCPGIDVRLDLAVDHTYAVRFTYRDRGPAAARDEIGVWSLAPDGATLALTSGGAGSMRLRVADAGTLRLLDGEGREIVRHPSYTLARDDELSPIEPRLRLRGMYRYAADAGRLTPCATGRGLPVAQLADNAALERAYLAVRTEPAAPLLVELEARVARLPRMEGPGDEPAVVVERFIAAARPGEACL